MRKKPDANSIMSNPHVQSELSRMMSAMNAALPTESPVDRYVAETAWRRTVMGETAADAAKHVLSNMTDTDRAAVIEYIAANSGGAGE